VRHIPRKRFGQNFLQDVQYQQKIAAAIRVSSEASLIEIGPGQGAITSHLLQRVPQLTVVEMDRDLVAALRESYGEDQLNIIEGDVLKVDFSELGAPLSIIGNLPYNISTPLIFHLLKYVDQIEDMVFMLQKEVVDRLVAGPGSKTYGRLSVMTSLDVKCEKLFNVPPGAFFPAPKVMSTVVRLRPREDRLALASRASLSPLVAAAFNQRRKTLRNSIAAFADEALMKSVGIDPQLRAENVSAAQYVALSDAIKTK